MSDLTQALAEINAIRAQVARGTQFRGYGPASVAASGILALGVAALQAFWLKRPPGDVGYLAAWVTTAGASVALATIETWIRARREHRGFAVPMLQSALEQFLPALIVGLLLTGVVLSAAPTEVWMLPGLWQLLFSLGIFASCRFLPRLMFGVGIWYLCCGLACLVAGSRGHALSPWAMGLPFGIGQLLVATVLHTGFGAADEDG